MASSCHVILVYNLHFFDFKCSQRNKVEENHYLTSKLTV